MSNEDNVTTNDFAGKEFNKKSKLIPICVVILVALCLGIGGFYFYFSSPKRIVTNVLNKAYENYDEMVNDSPKFDITKDKFKIKGDLTIDTNIDGLEELKEDKLKYVLGLDYKNQKMEIGGSVIEDDTTLIDAVAYIIGDKFYYTFKDDLKDLILSEDNDLAFDEEFDLTDLENAKFNTDDINYVTKSFKDILIDSIDEKDLEKSNDTLEIDGKDVKVTKVTYKLNKKRLEKLSKNIIDGMLKNEKLLKILANMSGLSVKEIKEDLKSSKKDMDIDDEVDATINFYTKGFTNEFAGFEIDSEDANLLIVENKESTLITADLDGVKLEFDVKEYSNEEINIDFKMKSMGEKIAGNYTSTTKKTKKNNYKGALSFSIKYDDYKFKLKANYEMDLNAKVADIDTKKAVKEKDAAKDIENAEAKIEKRFEKSKLYELFDEIFGSYEVEDNYDYDYDLDDYDYQY